MCSHLTTTIRSRYIDDHFNLNAASKRNLRHTQSAAGMGSALAKNLEQQFRSAIGNYVRFGKIWRAVHKNNQLHDAPYIVQVADGSLGEPQAALWQHRALLASPRLQ